MTLRCPVAMVKTVAAGEGVSTATWTAAGHHGGPAAGGICRRCLPGLGGRIDVLINGRLRPSIGRMCMDQVCRRPRSRAADVAEGDEAILFGSGASGEPTAQTWADLLDTINSEIVTSPRGRILRTYTGESMTPAKPPRARRLVGRRRNGDPERPVTSGADVARKAGLLAGVAGLGAVGTAAGRSAARRGGGAKSFATPTRGEDFTLLDADRGCVVTTADGIPLIVREVGPITAR